MKHLCTVIKEPSTEEQRYFSKRQECIRKDVERAFGFLQSKFQVLAQPSRLWRDTTMAVIMHCCIILHNMVVEQREDYDFSDAALGSPMIVSESVENIRETEGEAPQESVDLETLPPGSVLNNTLGTMRDVMDAEEHHALRQDLISHIWCRRGSSSAETSIQ